MNETAWFASESPTAMVWYLLSNGLLEDYTAGGRRFRLFACGCCRRAWHLIEPHPLISACVEAAEQHADGIGPRKRLVRLAGECHRSYSRYGEQPGEDRAVAFAAHAAVAACEPVAKRRMAIVSREIGRAFGETEDADHTAQADLLRCIFGNPFRPVTADPTWRTFAVINLTEAIYNGRAFDRLPILADALEEAGCGHPDVLDHCRGDGPHTRGCWVVDAMLGKR